MYITPRTDIRLLRGCPCDPEHVHSLYFTGLSAQESYFRGLTKYNLNNYSYQRYAKNILRVQILADNLYDVNYMMFRNTAYGDKWFYAFVDKIEYVNDVTTEVYYHLDDIQTWMFDWDLNQCFIERMHTPTDNVGDSITVEPVEVGEYVQSSELLKMPYYMFGNGFGIIFVAVTKVQHLLEVKGDLYDGVFSGCSIYAFSPSTTGVAALNLFLNEYDQKPDEILSIYMSPSDVLSQEVYETCVDHMVEIPASTIGTTKTWDFGRFDYHNARLDGYKPKNNKLYTYPYNYMMVTNAEGDNLTLRYEFYNDLHAKVTLGSCFTQPVQIYCVPYGYKNRNYPTGVNYTEKITLAGYPLCSWNVDSWQAWISQNSIPILLNTAGAVGSLALASYTPATTTEVVNPNFWRSGAPTMSQTNPASFSPDFGSNAGIYGIHQITNLLTSMYKASIAADVCKGNISSANALASHGAYAFWSARMSVNAQQAEIIDRFFTRFGYAINKIDTPRIHTRTEWTYIKTVDCTCHGSIPVDSEKNIESIFNAGITFWVNPDHVGNYSYDNVPLI